MSEKISKRINFIAKHSFKQSKMNNYASYALHTDWGNARRRKKRIVIIKKLR